MRITDKNSIEEFVAAQLASSADAYIAIDKDDYEFTKGLLGEPTVAIDSGEFEGVDSLLESVKQDLSSEDSCSIKGIILFIMTGREKGMTMGDLQKANSLFEGIPKTSPFRRSVSFGPSEGKHRIVAVLWK